MFHRIALRVLPTLSLAVTEPDVRRRKRWVMAVPGLVAFAAYRVLKPVTDLSNPVVLLSAAGALGLLTALAAYRLGRRVPMAQIWREDRGGLLSWVAGWIGSVYGMQLALLVLALLAVVGVPTLDFRLVPYDLRAHPDGPAMMALIIAVTSIARDAFEIGHLRTAAQERPLLTFPDGGALRAFLYDRPGWAVMSFVGAAAFGVAAMVLAARLTPAAEAAFGQLVVVSVVGGTAALLGYLGGSRNWTAGWLELVRFWWWPGVAFAATYELVALGGARYVLGMEVTLPPCIAIGAGVCGLMAVYAAALGVRRGAEDRVYRTVPESVLRCPFVIGILGRRSGPRPGGEPPAEWLPPDVRREFR